MKAKFILNGQEIDYKGDLTRRLLDVLREDYHLNGPKEGCGEGECGACSILLDGHIVNSCLLPMMNVIDHEIMTIEGFTGSPRYEIIKSSFEDAGAVQCGICTPGMIIATESLLNSNPKPTDPEIREGLSGNLCRCTGYNAIVTAVEDASKRGEGLW